jgi:hypothetical protein
MGPENVRPCGQIHCQCVANSSVLVGANVNGSVGHARVTKQVGAAIDRCGRTAIGITPPNTASEAGAAGAYGRRRRHDVKVWRCVFQIDEKGTRIQRFCIFPIGALPVSKTRIVTHVAPQD